MITLEWEGVEIDSCGQCGGVWFDRGELERLAGSSPVGDATLFGDLWQAPARRGGDDGRLCPRCDRKLESFVVASAMPGGLTLDRCRRGHGIWFDGGELCAYLRARELPCAAHAKLGKFLREVFGEDLRQEARENRSDF